MTRMLGLAGRDCFVMARLLQVVMPGRPRSRSVAEHDAELDLIEIGRAGGLAVVEPMLLVGEEQREAVRHVPAPARAELVDRKSVGQGKSGSVRVGLGGRL